MTDHAPMPGDPPILEARGVVVEYPGVRALDGVDFALNPGEILGLLGENGAGKSTLIGVLSGAVVPSKGELRLSGTPVRIQGPRAAERAGISVVRQELDLIPTMSVAENLGLGRQSNRWGLVQRRAMERRAADALKRLGVDIDVRSILDHLPVATQQLVAIARAMDVEAKALILDEPTSSLDADEARRLFAIMRRLRARGVGIIFITHFLEQAFAMCDRISVLRNGRNAGTWTTADLSRSELIETMTGRRITEPSSPPPARQRDAAKVRLSVRHLGRRRALQPVSLEVSEGEAVGLAGLLGSGRSEFARLIAGVDRPDSGEIHVDGRPVPVGSIRAAMAAGIAYAPEDRRDALALELSVRENIVLAMQAARKGGGVLGTLRRTVQDRIASHYIGALRIRTPRAEAPVRTLSGGNQQKVLLARWLAMQPHVMILDEPARGVDIGARSEIESLIASLRSQGLAIVLISAEMDELARVCSRAMVLRDRAAVRMLNDVSEGTILAAIAGDSEEAHG